VHGVDDFQIKLGLDKLEVVAMDGPKTWRLVKRIQGSAAMTTLEEAIFTVRGVICTKDMPPIYEKPS
jgi:hypothetical protein